MHSSRAARALFAFAFVVFLGQAVGAWSFVAERVCEQYCPDEPSGKCTPGCEDCVCCSLARVTIVPPAVAAVALPLPFIVRGQSALAPASADPGEIFHVPISSLA